MGLATPTHHDTPSIQVIHVISNGTAAAKILKFKQPEAYITNVWMMSKYINCHKCTTRGINLIEYYIFRTYSLCDILWLRLPFDLQKCQSEACRHTQNGPDRGDS